MRKRVKYFQDWQFNKMPVLYGISAIFIQSQSWNSSEKYPPMILKIIASFIFKDSVVDYF